MISQFDDIFSDAIVYEMTPADFKEGKMVLLGKDEADVYSVAIISLEDAFNPQSLHIQENRYGSQIRYVRAKLAGKWLYSYKIYHDWPEHDEVFETWNIEDPKAPIKSSISKFIPQFIACGSNIAVYQGNVCQILDMSTLPQFTPMGYVYSTNGGILYALWEAGRLYFVGGGVEIVDASNPFTLQTKLNWDDSEVLEVGVKNKTLYSLRRHIAASQDDSSFNALDIHDVSDPTTLTLISRSILSHPYYTPSVSNSRLYLSYAGQLLVYNLQNRLYPQFVSDLSLSYPQTKIGMMSDNYWVVFDYRNRVSIYRYIPETPIDTLSRSNYLIDTCAPDGLIYTDRLYRFIDPIPDVLQNQPMIMTRNGDRNLTSPNLLEFDIDKDGYIYVGIDSRLPEVPAWLSDWTRTQDVLQTDDTSSVRILYRNYFRAGHVALGPNRDDGSELSDSYSHYSVFFVDANNSVLNWKKYQE